MKKLFTIIASVYLTASLFAQTPEKMSYQAVIRNTNNNLVTNTAVGMRISILQGSASGTPIYIETQTPTSNTNGLVSIEIGGGMIVNGIFSNIDWANGPYFINTETDPLGGSNYTITGTSQLLSVPYALYAKTSSFSGRKIIDTLIINTDFTVVLNGCVDSIQYIIASDTLCNYWPLITINNLPKDQIISEFGWRYINGVLDPIGPALIYEHSYLYSHTIVFPGDIISWRRYYETFDDYKYVEFSYPVQ